MAKDASHPTATPSRQDPPLLEVRRLTKSFPGVRALQEVNLELHQGEVLAVIGENGAGKSTLMKILAGVQEPDKGEILLRGQRVRIPSVRAALELQIALIHQELNLADNLDVASNIFLGREPLQRGLIHKAKTREDSRALLDKVGLDCGPDTLVSHLSIGKQQMVEIAKALSSDARILIMDEPTSSLSQRETEHLFQVIRSLKAQGVSIIYISHRLGEVKELADRVTVLRDGANAGDLPRDEINHDRMVQLMVGRDVSQFYQRKPHDIGQPLLEVQDLVTPAHPGCALSFNLNAGEILGVAGLVGAGRTEMLQVLFGVDPALGGEILIEGQPVSFQHPLDAIKAGLALVPEDRKQQGLILEMAVNQNISLPSLRFDQKAGLINKPREQEICDESIEGMSIKTPSREQMAQYLSGGNQQKIVLGKWLARKPKVLLLDEPTRGIDVGAKQEIYGLMESLAEQGMGVLFVSSEMEEILGMSDRALVMHEGRITGELRREELSEEAVMQLATGRVSETMTTSE